MQFDEIERPSSRINLRKVTVCHICILETVSRTWCIATGGLAGCLVDEERPKPDKPLEIQIKSQECWERHTTTHRFIKISLHYITKQKVSTRWHDFTFGISEADGGRESRAREASLQDQIFWVWRDQVAIDPWTISFCYVREDLRALDASFGEQSAWPSFHSMFCSIETELDSHGSRGSRWSAGSTRWLGDWLGQELIWSRLKPSDAPELLTKVFFFLDLYVYVSPHTYIQEVAILWFFSSRINDFKWLLSDLLLLSTHVGWCSDSAAGWDDQQETFEAWKWSFWWFMIWICYSFVCLLRYDHSCIVHSCGTRQLWNLDQSFTRCVRNTPSATRCSAR